MWGITVHCFDEAKQAVENAIEKYNLMRPHESCDNLTPVQAHNQKGFLRKRWKTKAENQLLGEKINQDD